MYKCLIFDLGKVLIDFDFQRGYRALEGLCPYPAAEIPRRIGATGLVDQFETGRIGPGDFVARLSDALGVRVDYQRFCEIWSSVFTDPLVPEATIASLAGRYRLLLLSNTNALHFEMLRTRLPALAHFHDLILSYEVQAMKPHPEIYLEALRRAGCAPEQCFFTDDIAGNVAAARNLGIDAVQFESVAQLERELSARGIG